MVKTSVKQSSQFSDFGTSSCDMFGPDEVGCQNYTQILDRIYKLKLGALSDVQWRCGGRVSPLTRY